MIAVIFIAFVLVACSLALLLSYELRAKVLSGFQALIPNSKKQLSSVKSLSQQFNHAAAAEQTQTHWHIQQWWILIAGFFLFSSIILFAFTRPISATKIEADYLREVDPQVYALLEGEMLSPPPEVEEALVEAAVVEAMQLENQWAAVPADQHSYDPAVEDLHAHSHVNPSIVSADRKWHKMNPRYKQRLLMVFKIMKERHGYELVLLEGYRSPERQNSLSKNKNTTRARGYQSYHQFGLAADVAFKRNGKVVISERDPWAMRGYELYGEVAESVGLTWGGRWKSIKDYGHTEYRMPGLKKTREMAEKLTSEGQLMANALD
ncbi:M15 family metallopeptidase [Acinetobacter indicus]|uniref:M15 family metallopeptidase n=1 Tax=Acinetobacter indicus TaxID=756892 RepID=UPI002576A6D9|nr:M15 family metallopeptidase [Acinetobacter indicus]MDM1287066.1 M15 family metallopeptidase [Acinetobacter indicus]